MNNILSFKDFLNEGYGLRTATSDEAIKVVKDHGLTPMSWAHGVATPSGIGFLTKQAKFFRISDEEPPRVIGYISDPQGENGGRTGWVEYGA